MKTFKFKIPIYDYYVRVAFTDKEQDIVNLMVKNKDYYNADEAKDIEPYGTTYSTREDEKKTILIAMDEKNEYWKLNVLVHEVIHAAEIILGQAGYKEVGEPFAYLADFIFEQIFDFAKKEDIKI